MEFKDWLSQTKTDKPELTDFLTRAEKFFPDTGFNSVEFEKAIKTGLKKIEKEVDESLKIEDDAQDQKDNN